MAIGGDDCSVDNLSAMCFPSRSNFAKWRTVRGTEGGKVGWDVGLQQDMVESGVFFVGVYASQSFLEPCSYFAEHHVVVRYVASGFEVPVFEQCGGPFADPPPP